MKSSRAAVYLELLPSLKSSKATSLSVPISRHASAVRVDSALPPPPAPPDSREEPGPLPKLRLVSTEQQRLSDSSSSDVAPSGQPGSPKQLELPIPSAHDILVIDMETVRLRQFLDGLRYLRPRYVIDLRPVPFFNIEERRFDRRTAFAFFRELGTTYHDLATLCLLDIKSALDARLNPARLCPQLPALVGQSPLVGPIAVLLPSETLTQDYAAVMPTVLPPIPQGPWRSRRI